MKTDQSKNKLVEALRNLPGDFALTTARQHMINALKSIQKFEEKQADKKKNNLDIHNELWGGRIAQQPQAAFSKEAVMGSLNYIDTLIDVEKANLKNIQLEREKEKSNDLFLS